MVAGWKSNGSADQTGVLDLAGVLVSAIFETSDRFLVLANRYPRRHPKIDTVVPYGVISHTTPELWAPPPTAVP